jgi:hypothetical protein
MGKVVLDMTISLGTEHIELERTRVVASSDVTPLWFRVVKEK